MTRHSQIAWIVRILAEHDHDAEVDRKVFVGPCALQNALDWGDRLVAYETTLWAIRAPSLADTHSFRAETTEIEVDIDL